MKIKIQMIDGIDGNTAVETKEFTCNPEQRIVTETNAVSFTGMILLAIRYLASLGPY